MKETSGGLPPCTAVWSTVGRLSPAELYFAFTFGYAFLKASRTAWNDFCSSPAQIPRMLIEPLTSWLAAAVSPPPAVPASPLSSSSSPQAAARSVIASTSIRASAGSHQRLLVILPVMLHLPGSGDLVVDREPALWLEEVEPGRV